MKPAPFEYHRPASVEEALALLAEHGYEAKLLAGGQSLVPAMNFRLSTPAVLIDLNRIPGLDVIGETEGGGMRIGAMARQRAAERSPVVAARAPLIAGTLPYVAHAQIRNRGTIGGSIAHADPAGEMPAVMLALAARFHLRGPNGARVVDAADFFTGLFGTALEPDEMLVEAEIPAAPRTGWAFDEVSRRHGDYALAGVAAMVETDDDGRCTSARIALLSVGEGPVLAAGAATAIVGQAPTEDAIRAAAEAAARRDIDPPGDIHASPDYRRQLVDVLVRRVLPRAFERARAA